jgi:hypothetical protein
MDPFFILPAEITVSILEACTNFASLDGLLRASARADQVFGEYYQTIAERVGKNCPILSQGLQFAFRDIVLLESEGIFTPSSLPELLYTLTRHQECRFLYPLAVLWKPCEKQSTQRRVSIALFVFVSIFFWNVFRLKSLAVWSTIIAKPINRYGEAYPSLKINRFESNIILLPRLKYIDHNVSYRHLRHLIAFCTRQTHGGTGLWRTKALL